MQKKDGGIIGFWGASRPALGTDDERSLGPIDLFNMCFYKSLFEEEATLGEIVNMTKLQCISDPNMPYSDPNRAFLFTMNLLGDPELTIRKTRLQELFYRDLYFDENGTFNVKFTHEAPTRICIMSIDDNGENTYEIIDFEINQYPGDGYAFDLSHDHDYSICFTRPGFKPYIINLYYTGTIQNDIIANDAVLWSDQAKVGYDVDSNKANGPVVIEKGDVFIKAPQGTTIKSHFTLKKGATLTIDPTISEFSDDPDIATN